MRFQLRSCLTYANVMATIAVFRRARRHLLRGRNRLNRQPRAQGQHGPQRGPPQQRRSKQGRPEPLAAHQGLQGWPAASGTAGRYGRHGAARRYRATVPARRERPAAGPRSERSLRLHLRQAGDRHLPGGQAGHRGRRPDPRRHQRCQPRRACRRGDRRDHLPQLGGHRARDRERASVRGGADGRELVAAGDRDLRERLVEHRGCGRRQEPPPHLRRGPGFPCHSRPLR